MQRVNTDDYKICRKITDILQLANTNDMKMIFKTSKGCVLITSTWTCDISARRALSSECVENKYLRS